MQGSPVDREPKLSKGCGAQVPLLARSPHPLPVVSWIRQPPRVSSSGLVLFDFVQAVHKIRSIPSKCEVGLRDLSRSRVASGSISSSWSHGSPRSPGKARATPVFLSACSRPHLVPHLALLCGFGPQLRWDADCGPVGCSLYMTYTYMITAFDVNLATLHAEGACDVGPWPGRGCPLTSAARSHLGFGLLCGRRGPRATSARVSGRFLQTVARASVAAGEVCPGCALCRTLWHCHSAEKTAGAPTEILKTRFRPHRWKPLP